MRYFLNFIFCLGNLCEAQFVHPYDYYNDSLPSQTVTSIFQDSRGYLWISIYDRGLFRLDGANTQAYTADYDVKAP